MASKERIERVARAIGEGRMINHQDASALLDALNDANKRIAKLEADLDRVAPRQKAIGTVYLTPGETIEKLEAKLAKVREWAERYHGETFSGPGVDALIAILDGKDTL